MFLICQDILLTMINLASLDKSSSYIMAKEAKPWNVI